MKTFVDRNGVAWNLELNVGVARRVKSVCGVDLLDVLGTRQNTTGTSVLERFADDPELLVNVISCLCSEQLEERGMSGEDFACAFNGETIEAATDAMMEEIINFSPPTTRRVLEMIYRKSKEYVGKMQEELEVKLNAPETEREIDNLLNNSFTSTLESLE